MKHMSGFFLPSANTKTAQDNIAGRGKRSEKYVRDRIALKYALKSFRKVGVLTWCCANDNRYTSAVTDGRKCLLRVFFYLFLFLFTFFRVKFRFFSGLWRCILAPKIGKEVKIFCSKAFGLPRTSSRNK